MKSILKPFFYLFLAIYFIFTIISGSIVLLFQKIKYGKSQEYTFAKMKYKQKVGSVGINFKN